MIYMCSTKPNLTTGHHLPAGLMIGVPKQLPKRASRMLLDDDEDDDDDDVDDDDDDDVSPHHFMNTYNFISQFLQH